MARPGRSQSTPDRLDPPDGRPDDHGAVGRQDHHGWRAPHAECLDHPGRNRHHEGGVPVSNLVHGMQGSHAWGGGAWVQEGGGSSTDLFLLTILIVLGGSADLA